MEENILELNKIQLTELLGVSKEALKKIEQKKQLHLRLYEKGYEFIKKEKHGKMVYYTIKKPEDNYKEILNNTIEYVFGTKKHLSFSEYFTIRFIFSVKNWQGASIKNISNHIGVNKNTIGKWDKTLREKEIIKQEGYYYYKRFLDKNKNVFIEEQINEDEYKSFWRNKAYLKAMKGLQYKYDEGIIDFTQLQLGISDAVKILENINEKYCFRVKRYIIDQANELGADTFSLIKKVYLTDIGLDFFDIKK